MEKVTIYTIKTCPYCKQIKEELIKNNIEFEEKLTSETKKEWQKVTNFTRMPTTPMIYYKNNYFVPGRDFGNPQGLINILKEFKESEFPMEQQNNEIIRTLNYNIIMAFNRVDGILKQIETNTKKEEDGNKSTN